MTTAKFQQITTLVGPVRFFGVNEDPSGVFSGKKGDLAIGDASGTVTGVWLCLGGTSWSNLLADAALASDSETITGTNTTKAVTPFGHRTAMESRLSDAVSPAADDATGSAGSATTFARGDHKHAQPVLSGGYVQSVVAAAPAAGDDLDTAIGKLSKLVNDVPASSDNTSSGYFDHGDKREQWGVATSGDAVVFPVPFADTTYAFTATLEVDENRSVGITSKTTTGHQINTRDSGGTHAARQYCWRAVGKKP